MAEVLLHCPLCTGMLSVDSSLAGSQVACPTCQGVVSIPYFEQPGYAPPPPPAAPDGLASLNCPLCAGLFQVHLSSQGQQVACPHCAGLVQVPMFGPESGAAPPSFPGFGGGAPVDSPAPPEPVFRPKPLFAPGPPVDSGPPIPPQVRVDAAPPPFSPAFPDPRMSAPIPAPNPANRPIPLQSVPAPAAPPAPAPAIEVAPKKAPAKLRHAETVALLPTEDGGTVALKDPVKTVGRPGQEIELRQLTPEEKSRRRVMRNIVMVTGSLLFLTIVMIVLVKLR